MQRREFLVTGSAVAGGVLLAGCSSGSDDGSSGDTTSDTTASAATSAAESQYADAWYHDEDSGIVLRNVEGTVGSYSITISGSAFNRSGQDYSYVQLSFSLYDETDAKVGDALANTSGLDAGREWKFEALGTGAESAASFSIDEITVY